MVEPLASQPSSDPIGRPPLKARTSLDGVVSDVLCLFRPLGTGEQMPDIAHMGLSDHLRSVGMHNR
jgi:hypothetical protein